MRGQGIADQMSRQHEPMLGRHHQRHLVAQEGPRLDQHRPQFGLRLQHPLSDPPHPRPDDRLIPVVHGLHAVAHLQLFDRHKTLVRQNPDTRREAYHPGVLDGKARTVGRGSGKGQAAGAEVRVVGIIDGIPAGIGGVRLVENTVVGLVRIKLGDVVVVGGKIDEIVVCGVIVIQRTGVAEVEVLDRVVAVARRVDERVVAGAAEDPVIARAADDAVIAVFADEEVVVSPAEQCVVVIAAVDAVIARTTIEIVGAAAVPGARFIVDDVVAIATECAVVAQATDDRIVTGAPVNGVVAVVAGQTVIADAAVDIVVSGATRNAVRTGLPVDRVVVGFPEDGVVAVTGPNRIVAGAAEDRGRSGIGGTADIVDEIVPGSAIDGVVAIPVNDRVVAVPRTDDVGAIGDPVALGIGVPHGHVVSARRAVDRPLEVACNPVGLHVAAAVARVAGNRGKGDRLDRLRLIGVLIRVLRRLRRKIGIAVDVLEDDRRNGGGRTVDIGDRGIVDCDRVEVLSGAAVDAEGIEAAVVVDVIGVVGIFTQADGAEVPDPVIKRIAGAAVGSQERCRIFGNLIALYRVDKRKLTEVKDLITGRHTKETT